MLLEHIVTDQRYYPDYYRVTFYGNFPAAIRDKRFIVCSSQALHYHDCRLNFCSVSGLRVGKIWCFLRANAE